MRRMLVAVCGRMGSGSDGLERCAVRDDRLAPGGTRLAAPLVVRPRMSVTLAVVSCMVSRAHRLLNFFQFEQASVWCCSYACPPTAMTAIAWRPGAGTGKCGSTPPDESQKPLSQPSSDTRGTPVTATYRSACMYDRVVAGPLNPFDLGQAIFVLVRILNASDAWISLPPLANCFASHTSAGHSGTVSQEPAPRSRQG